MERKITTAFEQELYLWVETSLENENFKELEISLDGNSDKCDGYIGEIVFVKVVGTTSDNEKKILHLVVKHSKENNQLRLLPFKLMFEIELHFYNKVYPVLEKFQLEKNVPTTFDVPKCFKTLSFGKKEILVLENLKARGYELHDRRRPLNVFHMKAVLEQFGKLHALSFALREQRKTEFESILEGYPNFMGNFLTNPRTRGVFKRALDNGIKTLLNHEEFELAEKLNKMINDIGGDPADIMTNLVDCNEPQSAIMHGDGWINNFLFKYKGNNKTSPSELIILDWQTSYIRSPVLDLVYFFYFTASSKELQHFEDLMAAYYESFSKFLKSLGSNPEKVFPIDALKSHWRKYCIVGVIFSSFLLSFALCDKDSAPAFEDLQDEDSMEDMLVLDTSKNEIYFQRFRDVVCHYFECSF